MSIAFSTVALVWSSFLAKTVRVVAKRQMFFTVRPKQDLMLRHFLRAGPPFIKLDGPAGPLFFFSSSI